ncbi:MAG: hypothetical protein JST49_10250 [Bacteroidetes bacterium]|nr:hypothetical protein [Bacteroidota bacterium]
MSDYIENSAEVIKVYSYTSDISLECIDNICLEEDDLLIGYRKIAGIRKAINAGLWKIVGKRNVLDKEKLIPDYKRYYPSIPSLERDAKEWHYMINDNVNTLTFAERETVRHLELSAAYGTGLMEVRAAMEFIRKQNKNLNDYFDMNTYVNISMADDVYSRPMYSDIPLGIRGKRIV